MVPWQLRASGAQRERAAQLREQAMAIRTLLAVDGSAHSDRATGQVLELIRNGAQLEVTVIQVQPFMSIEAQAMHLQQYGEAAMRSARALLDAAGVSYKTHIAMGPGGVRIAEYAIAGGGTADGSGEAFGLVVLGSHGLGWVNTVLVGSVAKHVVDHCTVPVLLVR
jgi:nucleotide-binding universal stress UspA family protein